MIEATLPREETDFRAPDYIETVEREALLANTPLIINVPEMVEDMTARDKAANLIRLVLGDREFKLEEPSIKKPIESLHEGIGLASKGEETAIKLVETNTTTDFIERVIKSGIVLKPLELQTTAKGKLLQHDQMMDSVLANSLLRMGKHPIMGMRVASETRNSYRIETLAHEGYLDEYNFVVFSLAEDLAEAGFFTETMTCAIQVTSKTEDGLELEPAFVAGVAGPKQTRHDLYTIKKLYAQFGVDISNMTPSQIIDTPLLVHKDLMPNGAIDLVEIWDKCAGGTFFGESKPVQNYLAYLNKCKQQQELFEPIGKEIAAQLIAEAEHIKTPHMAFQRLNKLSAERAVELAIADNNINPLIFGQTAAEHIVKSREYARRGQTELAEQSRRQAVMVENSSSCPSMDALSGILASIDAGDGKGPQYFSCHVCGHVNKRPFGGYINSCGGCASDVSCK